MTRKRKGKRLEMTMSLCSLDKRASEIEKKRTRLVGLGSIGGHNRHTSAGVVGRLEGEIVDIFKDGNDVGCCVGSCDGSDEKS